MAYMVLLTNGDSIDTPVNYALKVDSLNISYSKTPIQVPLPESSPLLLDLGMYRPNVTIGGLVDNSTSYGDTVTLSTSNEVRGTSTTATDLGFNGTYTIPSKNELEDFITDEVYNEVDKDVSLIIVDPNGVDFNYYKVIIQSASFMMAPTTENRYTYNLTFAAGKRNT